MKRFIKILRRIIKNPFLNILVGLFLLYSGIMESVHAFKEIGAFRIGVHHGIIVFACMNIFKTLPDLFEGLERVGKIG
jgi:hypothetical protein